MVLSPLYNLSFAIPILTIGRSATLGSWVPWDFDSKHSSGAILSLIHIRYNMVGTIVGLPRWSTGKESARQFRRCRRDGQSLGQEDSLEEEMATHSSILAERIQWMKGPGGPQFKGLQRVRHNRVYTHAQIYWRENKNSSLRSLPKIKINFKNLLINYFQKQTGIRW